MADLPALKKFLSSARSRTDASAFPELRSVLAQRDNRGRRRHDTGLTQAHMDILLGRTPGTYERLERGTGVRKNVLEESARVLRLTEDEWRTAHRFAFGADPPHPLSQKAGLTLPGAWLTALDSIESIAWISDPEGRLLAHNAAFAQLFDHGGAPSHPLRWALTSPEARVNLIDWETAWAPFLMARLRAALALQENSTPLTRLRTDVLSDASTAELFEAHSATAITTPPSGTPLPCRHPQRGTGWLTLSTASPDDAPGTRLTIATFHPGAAPTSTPAPASR
ncbi:MmyB family transcriptional regulator [Actinacidiphila acididurans]|uniref:Helix-turn-helix domain-containing protein n=1 Tax=Actinacidiphila acididurans TaxID=2784346 RepID=A0ABS2U0H3_9ACTN|nr:helix-turn-helix domain-containing protein [Actinacidiphila acididurans]MBM9508040.1 helix-turn-helix domain-containing protein [Actinacidiphila acididurans]